MKQGVNAFCLSDESYSISSIFYAEKQQMQQRLGEFYGVLWTDLLAKISK
jgi:hypothetical protein